MTATVLALVSAIRYGAADFLGGLSARRTSAMATAVLSQLSGFAVLAIAIPLLPGDAPNRMDFAWGGASGVAGGIGLLLLYRALAVGVMSIVAPVTAVNAAALPVIVAAILGERPDIRAGVGIVMGLAAITLVSREPAPTDASMSRAGANRQGVMLALGSGLGIGVFYICLAQTRRAGGAWPLLACKVVALVLFGSLAAVRRLPLFSGWPGVRLGLASGAVDMASNICYTLASQRGMLSIVAVLASLYPASTVLLAHVTLGERLGSAQKLGLVCAVIAVALIATSTAR